MNFDETQIYEPLDNSDLKSIIPKDDKILYSNIFEISMRGKESDKYRSHGILTDKGVALSIPVSLPFQSSFEAKSIDSYYFPWHAVKKSTAFSTRLLIGDLFFRIEANKDIEAIKPIYVLNKEFVEKSKILIKQSKDELYEKLLPILKSYPKDILPLRNTSEFSMLDEVYHELRNRYIIEAEKVLFEYPPRYKPIPPNLYYGRERIIEEIKNYNIAQGSYEEHWKKLEMSVVFKNYFEKHTFEETINLVPELFEINAQFVSKWYSDAINDISKCYPKREKEFYELERIGAERIIFKSFFKKDEYIITHFKGKINLPNAHLEYLGHIYLTNYQLISPNIPRAKGISYGTAIISGIRTPVVPVGAIIGAGIAAHIKSARKKFARVFKQNPDMFYIKNPYYIEMHEKPKGNTPHNIKFKMSYTYENQYSIMKKYDHVITIKIDQFKKTSSGDFKQKKKEVITKSANFFSQLPNTTCPKCLNVQDKNLQKCEKCGKKMNVTFKFK